ncbi:MAG: hypothetical protein J3R72DRAFT_450304 [Linnemannia gamsii]|nr:MAG: hypothetical protein J3R72DRAFT_450304 [Linnemannia gamsii]
MHFSKTTLLTITLLVTLLSITSTTTAQWVRDASPACKQCLLTARNAQVPSCVGIPEDPRSGRMTPQARSCQCGAAKSDAWIQSCRKPDACDNTSASIMKRAYAGVKIGCDHSGISSASSLEGDDV